MIAFEVHVNGKLVCTAGNPEMLVLSTILTAVRGSPEREETFLSVGGLLKTGQEEPRHADWLVHSSLAVGNEISVRIVDVPTCDPPAAIRTRVEIEKAAGGASG
jgi:hypothetical protein